MVFGIQSMKRRGVEINRKRKVKRCTSLASPKNVQHQTRRTLFLRPSVWYKRSVSRTEKKFGRKAQNPACVRVRTRRNEPTRTYAGFWHVLPFFSFLPHSGKRVGVTPTGRAGRCPAPTDCGVYCFHSDKHTVDYRVKNVSTVEPQGRHTGAPAL